MIKRSIGIFCTIIALVAATSFSSLTIAQPAYADTTQSDKTTCAIEKIGWLLCPVIEAFSKICEWAFKWIAKNFLYVDAGLFDNNSGTKTAWEKMRDIANVAFVLAFLVLIYSQITGMGAGSYGWKRMLPRLIIAAILVNTSYYLCQIMVDISNLLGFSLQEFLSNIASDLYKKAEQANEYASAFEKGNLPLTVLATAILGSAAVWLLLPILGSAVMSLIVVLLITLLTLLLRKALIVLLIFISPLAFVAYLLPNTEKYFKKWASMFMQLLLVFPVIALLFGAGQLSSAVVLSSNYDVPTSDDPATKSTAAGNAVDEHKQASMAMGLIAAVLAGLPMILMFSVTTAAFKGIGMVNGIATMAKGRAGNMGKKWDQNSAYNRGKAIRDQAKQQYKTQKFADQLSGGGGRFNPRAHYTRIASGGGGGAWSKVTGGRAMTGGAKAGQAGLRRTALSASIEGQNKEVQNEMLALKAAANPIDEAQKLLREAALTGDQVKGKAAENVLMSSGGPGMDTFAETMAQAEKDAIRTGNHELITALKQNALQNHGGTMKEKGGVVASWAGSSGQSTMEGLQQGLSGGVDSQGRPATTNPFKGLSDSQIAKQTTKSMRNAVDRDFISPETAYRILNNTSASEDLGGDQREILQQLAARHTPPTPPSNNTPPAPPAPPAAAA